MQSQLRMASSLVQRVFVVTLVAIWMVVGWAPRLWSNLNMNRVAVQGLRLGMQRKPLSPVEVIVGSERRQPDADQSLALSRFQYSLIPCRDIRQSRILAGLYLLNGQPDQALDALACDGQDDLLSRYFKALACLWQERSDCGFSDPDSAQTLMRDGIHLWIREYYAHGLALLLLSEQLDDSVRPDKARMYRFLSEGSDHILGDRQQAIRWARTWNEAKPTDPDAYLFLSGYYIWEGQLEEAGAILEIAERYGARQNWRFGNHMGQVCWARGDRDRAIEYYFESYQLNPTDPGTAWYLGSALAAVGRDEEARPYLEMVTRADRSRPYWAHLAEAAEEELKRMAQRSE